MALTYTIRESPKAKHVSLKMTVTGDLEVIVPIGFDRDRVPAIIQKKHRWIERVRRRMETQQQAVGQPAQAELPDAIDLQAIQQHWKVEYSRARWVGIKLSERANQTLVLSGDLSDPAVCNTVLQRWIIHKAKLHLPPWLRSVSKETALPFETVTVRQQKTLWGSCSARKTISLNCKLLFLPAPMVRYVLIHELCHTQHLNHSAAFWSLVGSYEPDYKELDAGLQDARYCVPLWMEV